MKEKWLKELGLEDNTELMKKINDEYDLGDLFVEDLEENKEEKEGKKE